MILPTGQIMFTDFSGLVEIYTPASGVNPAAIPIVLASSTRLFRGSVITSFMASSLTDSPKIMPTVMTTRAQPITRWFASPA